MMVHTVNFVMESGQKFAHQNEEKPASKHSGNSCW